MAGHMISLVWIFLILPAFYHITQSHTLHHVIQMNQDPYPVQDTPQCDAIVDDNHRFDCQPDPASTQESCTNRGCCWKHSVDGTRGIDVPYCYFPANYPGYSITHQQNMPYGLRATLQRTGKSHWPDDVMELTLDVYMETKNRLHFKIYDPNNARYEVPIKTPNVTQKAAQTDYKVKLNNSPFGITVSRASTGAILFDSALFGAPLIFADQFIQISTITNSSVIYGLGENKARLQKGGVWSQYSLWNRDQPPTFGSNLYGSHPFFINLESDGRAHGVFLLNSNAMDVALSPLPAVTFRTIGGILDFYVFTGPTPDDVVSQYTDVIGKPFLPPYWSLGFHLCRYGYTDTDYIKRVVARNRAINIPYEVQWADIDYMDAKLDWTYDPDRFAQLPQLVDDLHQHDQKFIMIIDPGIGTKRPGQYPPYDEGLKKGVFVLNATGQPLIGAVWPGPTVFPDFSHPDATDWWTDQARDWHTKVPYDSIWIDMNEPSNFMYGSTYGCTSNKLDKPPYVPGIDGNSLPDKTLCPSAKHHAGSHYNLHNMYGLMETMATNSALRDILKKRSIIISRSTFPSQGSFGGHWSGDISSTWEDLQYSIPVMLEFGMYGIPFVGADICGFGGNTTEELCVRWMQLGAFYPFMRNHNALGSVDQDPAVFSSSAQQAMTHILNVRYSLLPYLYTQLVNSHVSGRPVARPLSFIFPEDKNTHDIDSQFMWGSHLLISPVLTQGATSVEAYFPDDLWYDIHTGKMKGSTGFRVKLDAPLNVIPVHVRGGSIIPLQYPDVTTKLARINPFSLIVALNKSGGAEGYLVWDDGEELDVILSEKYTEIYFHVNEGFLQTVVMKRGYVPERGMTVETVRVLGVGAAPTSVTVDGREVQFTYDPHIMELLIPGGGASILDPLTIRWR